jgi:hypothetical protein
MMDRRGFIGALAATASFAAASCATRAGAAPAVADWTPDVGRKFYPDGRVHPFPGATIVCHVDQQGPNAAYFNALLDVFREAPRYAFARKVAFVPPSSYHMTVFDLVTDEARTADRWPDGLALDATLQECNAFLAERLRAFHLETEPQFRMRLSVYVPAERERTLAIRLQPVDAAEEARIRRLRDRLSNALGIRAPNHDTYGFHTTLGYYLRWLSAAELAECRGAMEAWQAQVAAASPQILLAPLEFCTFRDMFAFERQFFLGQG